MTMECITSEDKTKCIEINSGEEDGQSPFNASIVEAVLFDWSNIENPVEGRDTDSPAKDQPGNKTPRDEKNESIRKKGRTNGKYIFFWSCSKY